MNLKLILPTLVLIALSFELAVSKLFADCDFAIELYKTHEIPRDEIYKHFCIASTLHTTKNNYGFMGIYAIGSEWWCGENEKGGGCNVKCSDLVDDDIADDVRCANLILSQQGLRGWQRTEDSCKSGYEAKTNECLASIDILEALQSNATESVQSNATDTTKPAWMFGTSTTTAQPTTIGTARSTTAVTSTRARPTATERPVPTSTEKVSSEEQQRIEPVAECACRFQNTLITLTALALVVLLIVVVIKYQSLKRYRTPRSENHEYENSLII